MSSTAADYADRLNLAETVARIEQTNANTAKLVDEAAKLRAEAAKFQRETHLAPWALAAGAIAGVVMAAITLTLRALGVVP